MPRSIAVFGAGPALGREVARRYASQGYDVALVARDPGWLDRLARELAGDGATAHAVPADLSDPAGVPSLAQRIRDRIGNPSALYYGPSVGGAGSAAGLTPQQVQAHMPTAVYSLVALVREFVPPMIEQQDGAILVAAGASAVQGMPDFSGPGPALAAQRNYLQSLGAELSGRGVYVGRLYIGAAIRGSAWHTRIEAAEVAGHTPRRRYPVADPAHLADLLAAMHQTRQPAETIYPDGLFG